MSNAKIKSFPMFCSLSSSTRNEFATLFWIACNLYECYISWHFYKVSFSKTRQNEPFLAYFINFCLLENVNVARFARNVEWDYFCNFQHCEMSYFIEMWVYVWCRKLCYWSLFCSMPEPVQVCSTCHVSAFFARVQYFLCRWVASRLLFLCPTKLFVLSKKMKIMIADTCFVPCVVVVTDLTGWS